MPSLHRLLKGDGDAPFPEDADSVWPSKSSDSRRFVVRARREVDAFLAIPDNVEPAGTSVGRRPHREAPGRRGSGDRQQRHQARSGVVEGRSESEQARRSPRTSPATVTCRRASPAGASSLTPETEELHPASPRAFEKGARRPPPSTASGLIGAMLRTLRSTNSIENLHRSIKNTARTVKRWRGSPIVTPRVVTGILEAGPRSRQVRGYREFDQVDAGLARFIKPVVDLEAVCA